MPACRNGRRGRLKICCGQPRAGSSPAAGSKPTTGNVEKSTFPVVFLLLFRSLQSPQKSNIIDLIMILDKSGGLGVTMNLFLFILAIVPVVVLLTLIYFGDKIEKEPVGLVFALLGMGVLSIIPAVICEWIGEFVLNILFRQDSVIYNFFLYFFVVAVA